MLVESAVTADNLSTSIYDHLRPRLHRPSNVSSERGFRRKMYERMRVRFHDGFSLEGPGVADRRIMLARIRERGEVREEERRARFPSTREIDAQRRDASSSSSSSHLTIRVCTYTVYVYVRVEGGSYLQRGTSRIFPPLRPRRFPLFLFHSSIPRTLDPPLPCTECSNSRRCVRAIAQAVAG